MKRLHVLVLRAFFSPFLASFSVTLFILVLQFLAKYQDELFGKGLGAWVIAQLFMFASIQMAVIALPIAILVASLMTMGTLGERYEMAAMKSAGISLFRILRPLVVLSVFLAVGSFFTSWYVIPFANSKLYSLLYDMKRAKPELALQPGVFERKIEGFVIYYSHRDPISGALRGVRIWQHNDAMGVYKRIVADSCHIITLEDTQYMRMMLYRGESIEQLRPEEGRANETRITRLRFDSTYTHLDISGFGLRRTDENLFKGHRYMLTLPELYEAVDSIGESFPEVLTDLNNQLRPHLNPRGRLSTDSVPAPNVDSLVAAVSPQPQDSAFSFALGMFPANIHRLLLEKAQNSARSANSFYGFAQNRWYSEMEDYNKFLAEIHLKFALPLACIVFLFVGAPLGAIVRKGGLGMPVVVSIGFFILFYTLMTHGRKMAYDGQVEVWFGIWLPVLAMFPIAVYLTYQSSTDSRLFDLSSYKLAFQGIMRKIGLMKKQTSISPTPPTE